MAPTQEFGGSWTQDKLKRVGKYLHAYTTIFNRNPGAILFKTTYVDGFAGTGYRRPRKGSQPDSLALFDDQDARSFQQGSARIALETDPPFGEYLFIERSAQRARELERLREEFPERAQRLRIVNEEANSFLHRWCAQTDWRANRAVVFLDPFGMEVEWATLEKLAQTRSIDLWLLFPLGQAVIRLLTKARMPPPQWADRLTRIFGTSDWRGAFYRPSGQSELFEQAGATRREADFVAIGDFFVQRLKSIFAQVAPNPLQLCNSKQVPIYLLCFAAGNPRGARTAVKIASDILGR